MPARRGAGPSSPRAASPPGPPFARSPCPREPIQPGPSGVCLCPARVCHLFLGARPPRHWPFPSVTPGCALLHLRLLSWPVAQDEAPSLAPRIPRSPPPSLRAVTDTSQRQDGPRVRSRGPWHPLVIDRRSCFSVFAPFPVGPSLACPISPGSPGRVAWSGPSATLSPDPAWTGGHLAAPIFRHLFKTSWFGFLRPEHLKACLFCHRHE